jgi:hypothetical protein
LTTSFFALLAKGVFFGLEAQQAPSRKIGVELHSLVFLLF